MRVTDGKQDQVVERARRVSVAWPTCAARVIAPELNSARTMHSSQRLAWPTT